MKTEKTGKNGKLRKTVRIIAIVLAAIILLPIITLIIGRGVNDIRARLPGGIREKGYIKLGGIEQYINIRGADTSNPVIIFLHGGPGGPTSYILPTQQCVETDYTFIYWDQRGSGRSYIKSPYTEISFDILLNDLDELVDYAAARFNQPIIIVGHSWGTLLGITYAKEHPDKIAGYIGMGQVVSEFEAQRLSSTEAARLAREAENEQNALEIEALYQEFLNEPVSENNYAGRLNGVQYEYLPFPIRDVTIPALLSPDFGWDNLRWELSLGFDIYECFNAMEPLFKAVYEKTPPDDISIPVVFINGNIDYSTPAALVQEYAERLTAPKKEVFILQGFGHVLFEDPMDKDLEIFSETLRKALAFVLE